MTFEWQNFFAGRCFIQPLRLNQRYYNIIIRYNNRRANRGGKFLNTHKKILPDHAENLAMEFSEMYILKMPGGSDPKPSRDPRLLCFW